MTKRLGVSDRRAVDLLLDRSTGMGNGGMGNGDGNGGYVTHAQPATEPGIQGVQKVLSLLDLLPSEEPPIDLVTRTMARVDARAGTATPVHPAAAALMTNRPHA
ncbi:MAG: hypothetical protein WBD40_06490 [Tepidisphaeraceae bacterium]